MLAESRAADVPSQQERPHCACPQHRNTSYKGKNPDEVLMGVSPLPCHLWCVLGLQGLECIGLYLGIGDRVNKALL